MPLPTDPPRVLVILAAFNGTPFLPTQMDSILSQQAVAVQVVVSVDRSSDGTGAWMEQLARQEPRVSVLPFGDVFGGAAPNFFRLIRDADLHHFDFLSFSDQDDSWHPDKLARACQRLQHTGAAGYSSNVTAFWPSGKEKLIDKAQQQREWDFLFEAPGPGCTFVMTKKLALHLQAFVKENFESLSAITYHDWLTYAFARAHGYHWLIDPVPGMRYRQHDANQLGANAGLLSFVKRARSVLDGWWLRQSILTAHLVGLSEHPFVKRWASGQRIGLVMLALQARHCRRKRSHQVLFALSCLLLAIRLPGRGQLQ